MEKKSALPADMADKRETLSLAEEEAELTTTRVVDGRVKVTRTTVPVEKLLEGQLTQEEVSIEHITKNERLHADAIPQVREEGDVLIIPVIEEEVEIIRHSVLKEEIHIHKRKIAQPYEEKVILRRQEVKIVREDD